jgi:uncharacterized protein (TIGR02145 family)
MKKFTVLSFLLFFSICIYSQDYLISFAGTGGSTSVDNVKVENLTQGYLVTVPGGNQLRLKADYTNMIDINDNTESALLIYPNPAKEFSILEFNALKGGSTYIEVFNLSGKQVAQMQSYLEKGKHSFNISGVGSGVYIVSVKINDYNYVGKIISQSGSKENIQINYNNKTGEPTSACAGVNKLKSTEAVTIMQYNTGDRLKFTGFSGIYSTVLTDIPFTDETVTFDFMACTDGDNNHYPVVKIGAQTWMAENLKTTRLNNGTIINNIADGTAWSTQTIPAYCWYSNNVINKDTYGALYNWHTVNTSKLCPAGWQVPSDEEWTALTTYLGGDTVAGGKLKETGTVNWSSPNAGATNETGFSVRGASYRGNIGNFGNPGACDFFWSNTQYNADHAIFRYLGYNIDDVNTGNDVFNAGFSVRCLKEAEGTITDVEGNVYHTVTIGTQTWTVENLKTTKYNNGDTIPRGTAETWPDLTTPAYCWYNDSATVYKETYGALYNWYTVDAASNGGKNICPTGWHVPEDDEWATLTTYLGGEDVAGGKLKETGTTHWIDNIEATNEFGFTALPGGTRWDYEDFCCLGYSGCWWSITPFNTSWAWYRQIDSSYPDLYSNYHDKYKGMSVRCIKN